MGRQICTILVGKCGVDVGHQFWKDISIEHKVDANGHYCGTNNYEVDRIGVYYDESTTGRFVPRNLFLDTEICSCEYVQLSDWGSLYRPDGYVNSYQSCFNNFGIGFIQNQKLNDIILDRLRKQVEDCDNLQGFQMIHSLGGGTGSGCGAYIVEKLKHTYTNALNLSFSIFPSPDVSDVVVEPYNTIFACHRLIENVDQVVCFDNEVLHFIVKNMFRNSSPSYADLNRLIGLATSTSTAGLRYPGQNHADLRKISLNLVPFPRLHFLFASFAPLSNDHEVYYRTLSVQDLAVQLFHPKSTFCSIDTAKGLFLAGMTVFRGDMSTQQIDQELLNLQLQNCKNYVDWIPNNICQCTVNIPNSGYKKSAGFLGNNTDISTLVTVNCEKFTSMFEQNAFVHWYTNAGMEENEFTEAQSNCMDLAEEYITHGAHPDADDADQDGDNNN